MLVAAEEVARQTGLTREMTILNSLKQLDTKVEHANQDCHPHILRGEAVRSQARLRQSNFSEWI